MFVGYLGMLSTSTLSLCVLSFYFSIQLEHHLSVLVRSCEVIQLNVGLQFGSDMGQIISGTGIDYLKKWNWN